MMSSRRMWLRSVIMVSVLAGIVHGQAEIYGIGKFHCSNTDSENMFKGVDITDFDMMPVKGFDQNFKKPALRMTCVKGFKDENGVNNVPDQFKGNWKTDNKGSSSAKVQTLRSSTEVRDFLNKRTTLTIGFGPFTYSKTKSYNEMEATLNKRSSYVQSFDTDKKYRIGINDDPELSFVALAYVINFLKGVYYEENQKPFDKFIELFGTHYFETAHFKGRFSMYSEVKKTFFANKKTKDVSDSMMASVSFFKNSVGFGKEDGDSKSKTSTAYNANSAISIKYFGGYANTLDKKGFSKWGDNVPKDAWLAHGTLKPLAELFPTTETEEEFKTAVKHHVWNSFYDQTIGNKPDSSIAERNTELRKYIKRYIQLQGITGYTHDQKVAMTKEFEYRFIIPNWFKEVNFCMKITDKNNKDCAVSSSSSQICTPVDDGLDKKKSDNFYVDKTKNNACKQNWGIWTQGSTPEWFKEVSVCYRYYGNSETKCKGRSEDEVCGYLNEYGDLSDDANKGKLGDCYVSWRISAPFNAPTWFKRSKLCLTYGIHDHKLWDRSGRCNGAINNTRRHKLCARMNEWTDYYRNEAMSRDSNYGCFMKWAIQTYRSEDENLSLDPKKDLQIWDFGYKKKN